MCLGPSQFRRYVVTLSEFCSRKEPHSLLSTRSHFILGLVYPWEGQGMTWFWARKRAVMSLRHKCCVFPYLCVDTFYPRACISLQLWSLPRVRSRSECPPRGRKARTIDLRALTC